MGLFKLFAPTFSRKAGLQAAYRALHSLSLKRNPWLIFCSFGDFILKKGVRCCRHFKKYVKECFQLLSKSIMNIHAFEFRIPSKIYKKQSGVQKTSAEKYNRYFFYREKKVRAKWSHADYFVGS